MPEAPEQNTTAASQKRWGALRTSLLCWLIPATAARRSAHVRLWAAFLCHVGAAFVLFLVLCGLEAWSGNRGLAHVIEEIGEEMASVAEEIARYPLEALAVIGGVVLGVEAGYLALALLFMSWGARDEPVRRSYACTLGRLWIHASHVVVATFLIGLVAVPLDRASSNWWGSQPSLHYSPPQPPANVSPGTPAWDAYQAEMDQYRQQYHEHWQQLFDSRPWHAKYSEVIIFDLGVLVSLWFLWALLRALGAERPVPVIDRPPTCETCGYNLTAAAMEGRCPECGQNVVLSLGPDVRPGTLWQRRHEVGHVRAWWRCSLDAMVRPRWFGRQLKTLSSGGDHRVLFMVHLVLIFFIAAVGIILCAYADFGRNPFVHSPEIVWFGGPGTGCVTVATVLVVAMLAAGVAGVGQGLDQKRNLMPAAMQAASYLAGYCLLWTFFSAVLAAAAFVLEDWFRDLQRTVRIDDELLAFLFWLGPNVICLLFYFVLVWRATAAARYANR